MEQLPNMNQNLPMSYVHTAERYFHGGINHMFARRSSSSPQIYSSADISMLQMKEMIFQQTLVPTEVS